MDTIFFGTELCFECNMEFDFEYNPVKDDCVVCTHCGTEQHPCSLCDCNMVSCGGSGDCKDKILYVLREYGELED